MIGINCFVLFILFFLDVLLPASGRVIELYALHQITRYLHNVSFGLQHSQTHKHQCNADGSKRVYHKSGVQEAMAYTPNRRVQEQTIDDGTKENLQLGIVLAVGAHNSNYYDYGPAGSLNGLMSVWDSWVEHFFPVVSNTTSLVLLLDERDFFRQSHTKSVDAYLDAILIGNMGAKPVDCVMVRNSRSLAWLHMENGPHGASTAGHHLHGMHHGNHHQHRHHSHKHAPIGCVSNGLHLDSGYKVYYIDVSNSTYPNRSPFLIFASVYKFPVPEWAQGQDEEELIKTWRPRGLPGRFKTNYGYVKMTNWYAYHMLNLEILDFFDYAAKLDNDVSFVSSFPEPNLPLRLASKGTKMMATQKVWYYDDPRIAQGIRQCLSSYIRDESKLCGREWLPKDPQLVPGGINATVFWESNLNATFRAHFLVYWLGIYAAPEVKSLAEYWNSWHPRGMWDYRWGDQQWWPRPLSMFGSGNIDSEIERYDDINTDNEKYLVHKLWPRQGTVEKTQYFNISGSNRAHRDASYKEASKKFIY